MLCLHYTLSGGFVMLISTYNIDITLKQYCAKHLKDVILCFLIDISSKFRTGALLIELLTGYHRLVVQAKYKLIDKGIVASRLADCVGKVCTGSKFPFALSNLWLDNPRV